jgi:hypothetical protein
MVAVSSMDRCQKPSVSSSLARSAGPGAYDRTASLTGQDFDHGIHKATLLAATLATRAMAPRTADLADHLVFGQSGTLSSHGPSVGHC